jgi:dipeptidyl aminopeptidase/acylaminoacyl peptidase
VRTCAYSQAGSSHLASLDVTTGRLEEIATPYSSIGSVRAAAGRAVFIGASAVEPAALVQLDLATGRFEVMRRSSSAAVDADYLSEPEAIEFPTEHGRTAHGFFYLPRNRDYQAPSDERPRSSS